MAAFVADVVFVSVLLLSLTRFFAPLIATNLTFIVFELFDLTWMNWANNRA